MSKPESPTIERPPRQISGLTLGTRVFSLDLQRLLRARKTIILLVVQLLPVILAVVFILWRDLDGMSLFRDTVERVYIPFLLPLAALFFGGPTIVDEVEGRTITYLTLRPISRPILYLGKLASSMAAALGVTLLPIILLFAVCQIGTVDSLSDSLAMLGAALGAIAVGAITYTAIFAFLGVLVASTLLLGIVYFILVELVMASIPILELLAVKFHVRTIAGYQGTDRAGFLDNLVLDEPLAFDWWFGLLVAGIMTFIVVSLAAMIFKQRQYHV